jgi:sulfonate transport system substrate-binding protein
MFKKIAQRILAVSALFAVASNFSLPVAAQEKPAELRIDYATYNPSSLVLRKFGWLEEDLKTDGVAVRWVFSAGSNKANEYVSSNSIDFGSTAGAAALLARTNGVPLKTVYSYSRPEWAQILVKGDSPLKSLADLKGKKVAATRGTDPYFILLRGLRDAGLKPGDVEIVALQHSDGYLAWTRGNVDAWAALDPFLSTAEVKDGARPLFRKIEYNTFGVLNVREEFLTKYPAYVQRVIKQYERAREWIIAHPEEAARILSEEAKIDLAVATAQITKRTELKDNVGIPGAALRSALEGVVPLFVEEKLAKPGTDPKKALDELIDDGPAKQAIGEKK